jgi:MerR family mercuric resistance operon transcriptional regulator
MEMRIGQLASKTAVSVQTIRYYERRGFLKKPRRLSSGYRDYSPEEAIIINFIKSAQNSGFTLKEIGSILRLLSTHSLSAVEARTGVENKVREIDERIQSLKIVRNKLIESLKTCECADGHSLCPNLKRVAASMEFKRA